MHYDLGEVVGGERIAGGYENLSFAVFNFPEGEDRDTWYENPVHQAELTSVAAVLAELHYASWDFELGGLRFDRIGAFVAAYQRAAARRPALGPMNDAELGELLRMLADANLNLRSWEIMVYLADPEGGGWRPPALGVAPPARNALHRGPPQRPGQRSEEWALRAGSLTAEELAAGLGASAAAEAAAGRRCGQADTMELQSVSTDPGGRA